MTWGIGVVVIYFHKPSAGYFLSSGGKVGLFHYVYAVLVDTDCLSKEIQADIVAVEHHLNRALFRSPRHAERFRHIKAHGVAKEAAVVVGMGQQGEMLAFFMPSMAVLAANFMR